MMQFQCWCASAGGSSKSAVSASSGSLFAAFAFLGTLRGLVDMLRRKAGAPASHSSSPTQRATAQTRLFDCEFDFNKTPSLIVGVLIECMRICIGVWGAADH